jgi:hypothetical protein
MKVRFHNGDHGGFRSIEFLGLGHVAVVTLRHDDFCTKFWWRKGGNGVNGPGWMIRWRERPDDFRTFSERNGHGPPVRRIGPLSIKRLEPTKI